MKIREVLDRLDEINRRDLLKGAGAAALGVSAAKSARSQTDVQAIMNALSRVRTTTSTIGNAFSDRRFFNFTKELLEEGPISAYTTSSLTKNGTNLIVIYGSKKFVLLLEFPNVNSRVSIMKPETSPGIVVHGGNTVDLNSLEYHYKTSMFGNELDVVKLKQVFDGTQSNVASSQQNSQQLQQPTFSVKGIRLGMTKEEVDAVKKERQLTTLGTMFINLFGGLVSGGGDMETINFGTLLGVSGTADTTNRNFGRELSMQGMPAGLHFRGNRLVAITILNKTDVIAKLLDQMSEKFPGVQVQETSWQNKMGNTLPNREYYWSNVQGAAIRGQLRDKEVDTGVVIIADINDLNSRTQQIQTKKQKDLDDI